MDSSWKNDLLNLPDPVFFEIMRNYLGDLKTPFNKHDLIRSLSVMISKKETRDRIFSLLDEDDIRLLSLVSSLEETSFEVLFDFTSDYYSFLELHNRISNLQERLLICIEGNKQIRLNPVFEKELTSNYLDSGPVFPSMKKNRNDAEAWLTEQLLAAFISFVQNQPSYRKAASAFENIFTGIRHNETTVILEHLYKIASVLGLLQEKDGLYTANPAGIRIFSDFSGEHRLALLGAAAIRSYCGFDEIRLDTIAALFLSLKTTLSSELVMAEDDIIRLGCILIQKLDRQFEDSHLIKIEKILPALEFFGYIIRRDTDIAFSNVPAEELSIKSAIQSNSEINLPSGFPFKKEVMVSLCARLKHCDITRTYELERTAFSNALKSGLEFDEILTHFEENFEGPIPQNILFQLNAWNNEYSSIELEYGVVMKVSKERLPLIKHTPALQPYLKNQPAPGIFILDPAAEKQWRNAFENAGFDMIPEIKTVHSNEEKNFSRTEISSSSRFIKIQYDFHRKKQTTDPEPLIKSTIKKIEKLRVPDSDKRKLEAKAVKKLILSDSQLKVSSKPEETGEAGGLDHQAKIRLANRAIELDNLLEITVVNDLELESKLIKPVKVKKTEAEKAGKPPVYTIHAIELPDEEDFSVTITRISLMKMLKSSLFTP